MILYNYDRKRMTPFWERDLTMYNLKPCHISMDVGTRADAFFVLFTLHCSHQIFPRLNRASQIRFIFYLEEHVLGSMQVLDRTGDIRQGVYGRL